MFFLMSFWLASSTALESILGSSVSSSFVMGLGGDFVWLSWARIVQLMTPRGTPEARNMVRNARLDGILSILPFRQFVLVSRTPSPLQTSSNGILPSV